MSGKTLFPQTMGFLPWTTFERILQRHAGNHHVRSLRCSEQCRAMSFAQLTYRESLRDIETKSVIRHRNLTLQYQGVSMA